ncbi:MAG: M13 family metallopeptidase [Clostridia bacterium]|nr:M13 family metallopeptidase [Clostridia bacterium]
MEKIRIQDDLYTFVNQEAIEQLVIPDDMPTVGGFTSLSIDVEKLMIGEFNQMTSSGNYPNEYLQRACTLYKAAKNVKRKAKHGIAPALKYLKPITQLDSIKTFNSKLKNLVVEGLPRPFDIGVDTDMKDTSRHCVMIQGPRVILPDVTYYKEGMEQQKQAILAMWANMAQLVLAKTDLTAEQQAQYIQDTLAFDEIISKYVKSQQEWSEYVKMYNPTKTTKVCALMKPVSFRMLLKHLFGEVPQTIIVTEPRFFKAFSEVFNEQTFQLYVHWAYVTGLLGCCSLLSEELRDIGGMYRRALSGIASAAPVEKFAYQLASGMYSEPVGLYYGQKYFGEEAKKDIVEITKQIVETYKERILNNDFLEEATKQKAVLKLSKIGIKMGYPDKVRDLYQKLVFNERHSLFEMVHSLRKVRTLDNLSKLNKPVNHENWAMPGHMVNACYDPFANDVTFPAAILQPPFYSIKQTRSQNLGGIGAVIGHEISHAFDSNGASCDENGNLANWWTKADSRKFQAKIKAMIKEFDGIELPWGKCNGEFTVSENIADNGGMAVTLHIMSNMEGANFEEYFHNWARVWCMKAKPEYLQLLLRVDVHGPAMLRANMQPRNFPEWYSTFNVKKTDKMYLAPSKRVVIW